MLSAQGQHEVICGLCFYVLRSVVLRINIKTQTSPINNHLVERMSLTLVSRTLTTASPGKLTL